MPSPIRSTRLLSVLLCGVAACAGQGSGCGALATQDASGRPLLFTGTRLDNAAQVRVNQSVFEKLLSAGSLNTLLGQLNAGGGAFRVPCFQTSAVSICSPLPITKLQGLLGDSNFDAACGAGDGTPIHLTFKSVTWTLDPTNQLLHGKLLLHIRSGDLYFRTIEAHSTLSGDGEVPLEARVTIDDEAPGLGHQDTELDLDLQLSTAPDGRLEILPTQASLDGLLTNLDAGIFFVDGCAGSDPAPPASGRFVDDGCDSVPNGSFTPVVSRSSCSGARGLAGGGIANVLAGGCSPDSTSTSGIWCSLWYQARDQLLQYLKTTFKAQIVGLLQQQIDNLRCARPADASGQAVACDAVHACAPDDAGQATQCDLSRGVCLARGQTAPHCEPALLGLQGQLALPGLAQSVSFPADARLGLFFGVGGSAVARPVGPSSLQLAARVGTQPAGSGPGGLSVCAPAVDPPQLDATVPPLDFDDPASQPDALKAPLGDGTYDFAFSLSRQALARALYDGFGAGLFCVGLSDQTTPLLTSGLFKTFLPSLGLLTGGRDVPIALVLRPNRAPIVHLGRGTVKLDPGGVAIPDDPLLTLSLQQLDVGLYAFLDQRQVLLFTLTADVDLPLSLRTFPGAQADTLAPVLGGFETLLANVTTRGNTMLAEDPDTLKGFLTTALQLAEPLLAGALKPIALPRPLGLDLQIRGVGGAVAVPAAAGGGYAHLAIWASAASCGAAPLPACAAARSRTEASLGGAVQPGQGSVAVEARGAAGADFSFRVDGGLWSPWIPSPRFTVQSPWLRLPGHHRLEVTSRLSGDDRTQDPTPVVLELTVAE